jgi:limonene-1,2-epoxide hydrolase
MSTTDSSAAAAAVVDAFLAAINTNNLDAALAFMAPDVVYDNVPFSAVQGLDAVRAVLGPFMGPMIAIDWVVRRCAATGAVVMNERLDRFQRPDGSWLELAVAGVFEIHNGRITLWRDYFDKEAFLNAMK